MTDCDCWEASKVEGLCYYHAKLHAHFLTSGDGTNGHHGTLTTEQERFIGIQDPEVDSRWDYTASPMEDVRTPAMKGLHIGVRPAGLVDRERASYRPGQVRSRALGPTRQGRGGRS